VTPCCAPVAWALALEGVSQKLSQHMVQQAIGSKQHRTSEHSADDLWQTAHLGKALWKSSHNYRLLQTNLDSVCSLRLQACIRRGRGGAAGATGCLLTPVGKGRKGSGYLPGYSGGTCLGSSLGPWQGSRGWLVYSLVQNRPKPWSASSGGSEPGSERGRLVALGNLIATTP
jgi:hypothetical protein